MIRAIAFDLDGTLVQTDKLKALSYATAVQHRRGLAEPAQRAVEAYWAVVGSSRDEVARVIIGLLGFEKDLQPLIKESGVQEPADVLTTIPTGIYNQRVAVPKVVQENKWPHTVGLPRVARTPFCQTALTTMSQRKNQLHLLSVLNLED